MKRTQEKKREVDDERKKKRDFLVKNSEGMKIIGFLKSHTKREKVEDVSIGCHERRRRERRGREKKGDETQKGK